MRASKSAVGADGQAASPPTGVELTETARIDPDGNIWVSDGNNRVQGFNSKGEYSSCLGWHGEHGPARQAVFGIVQGGVHEDLRRESAAAVADAGVDGIAIGGTLGRDKEEMRGVLGLTAPLLPEEAPKHLLGIGDVDDLLAGIALGLDLFDCAIPTRLARHGTALVPDPGRRFRLDLRKAGWEGDREPILDGCPCPACRHHDRDYLSYLSRAEEITAVRLLCLHNLTFMKELTAGARAAIQSGTYPAFSRAVLGGTAPWAVG